ncbi:SHOCT domain-containing protein [Alkalibacter saccharofermentans]|nr:SHOCT domain-containing protein [Alkalibacter saccharofermentans]
MKIMMSRYFSGRGFDGFSSWCSGAFGGRFPFGGILMMIFFVVLAAAAVYLLLKNSKSIGVSNKNASVKKDTDYFVNLLKESYIKGELTDEEFEQKVKKLRDNE